MTMNITTPINSSEGNKQNTVKDGTDTSPCKV